MDEGQDPQNLIQESREYFKTIDSVYLFPNRYGVRMSTSGISSQIKKYGLKYGIREEVLHPHAFRHLFAILFLKQNKNIALLSDVLGHESLNTTAIYLRLSRCCAGMPYQHGTVSGKTGDRKLGRNRRSRSIRR